MNRVIVRSRIDSDGVLRVVVPVGTADAGRDVEVVIDPVDSAQLSREEWMRFVRATAGSIPDPTFERAPQGDYESRESFP